MRSDLQRDGHQGSYIHFGRRHGKCCGVDQVREHSLDEKGTAYGAYGVQHHHKDSAKELAGMSTQKPPSTPTVGLSTLLR